MRFDGQDPADSKSDPEPTPAPPITLDAAELSWDPWLRALYLRELASEQRPTIH